MRLVNKIPALILSLMAALIAFIIFAVHISRVSVDEEFHTENYRGIADSVKIYKNPYGICHVVANSEDDMFFAIGYCHARDRLWQMEFRRRAALGRLSEILGRRTVKVDMFMRAVGIGRIVEKNYPKLSKKSKSIYSAYCKGINSYIEKHENELSFEFGALNYHPEKWTPHDCLAVGRMMSFEMGISFWIDVALGEIAEKIGIDKALDLIAPYPGSGPYIIDSDGENLASGNASYDNKGFSQWRNSQKTFKYLSEEFSEIRALLGINGSSIGSNAWAMRKSAADTSAPIIANDAHLPLSLPAPWYQLHATSRRFNVTGLTLPGIPLFLSARNEDIGWGITNVMIDDCDFFIEKLDSEGKYYQDAEGNKKKIKFIADTLKIKNETDSVYYIRYTERSAIISDFHIFRQSNFLVKYEEKADKFFDEYSLTFRWTAAEPSDELKGLYRINTAGDWRQFIEGVNHWGTPGLNFTYADKEGNIGIAPAGTVPKRQRNCRPNLPNPAWLSDFDWSGFHRTKDLPRLYNPDNRYVASANNKTAADLPFFITNYWEPSSRAVRINHLLNEFDRYMVRDAQLMQMDVLSPYARDILDVSLPVIKEFYLQLDFTERKAFNRIKDWDYIVSSSSPSSAIYNAFYKYMVENTFSDELGERLFKEFCIISSMPHKKLKSIIRDYYSGWFDVKNTQDIERRDYIILKSFKEAVEELTDVFNTKKIDSWRYGDMHQLTLEHAFSEEDFLKPSVTLGPFPMGGCLTTLNNAEWRLYQPYDVVLGASMRFIADMSDSVVYTVLPGGVSGDALSPNYGDQVQLWLNGGYIQISIKAKPSEDFRLQTLLLPE